MALESPAQSEDIDPPKRAKPVLEIKRGGKFDETPFLRRIKTILPRVRHTENTDWLLAVFNQYHELLDDEKLKTEEFDAVEEIAAEASRRLADLGISVNDQGDEDMKKKTEYNL